MDKFVVISHTHWDREWYMPFSLFRQKLVDLIERLLKLLAEDPGYIFHLDAQTVVLEDYLEIHPEKKEILADYIRRGNIRVGPWYLQNDFYLSSGEATVRNLLIGRDIARSFGRCGKVGYVPDQFGIISQLPAILAGFDIRHFVFGRGYRKYELNSDGSLREIRLPCEFTWEGADGTKTTTTFLPCWYSNAQHVPPEIEKAHKMLDINAERFGPVMTTPLILMMNGCDHLEAQGDLNQILTTLRHEGRDIAQYGLDEYVDMQDKALVGHTLPIHRGALNTGIDTQILRGCWSSRIYLKQSNVAMQDMLEHKLEPLYAYLENGGFTGVYPKAELRYLWKCLLKNLPHDSICGCSADPVHRHMENRYEEMEELSEELLARGLQTVAYHSGHPQSGEAGNYCVVVFNPTARPQTGVTECRLRLFASENIEDFALVDDKGNCIPYEIVGTDRRPMDIFSPINLPGTIDMDVLDIRFVAENIAPLSAAVYAVIPNQKGARIAAVAPRDYIENAYYRMKNEGGSLVITDRKTGKIYRNPVQVEDTTDRGDSYIYRFLPGEEAIVVNPVHIGMPKLGALSESLDLTFSYTRPAGCDPVTHMPVDGTVSMDIHVRLTLCKESDTISLSYDFTNTGKDHRTRILLDSGLSNGLFYTDSPFDIAEREPHHYGPQNDSDTQCASTLAYVTDKKAQFSVFTFGQHEVERVGDRVAVTVVRSTGNINIDYKTLRPGGGDRWRIPGNQCLRPLSGHFGFAYTAPAVPADLFEKAKFYRTGFLTTGDSFDSHKYAGGRFSSQTSELSALYYLPDENEGRVIPASLCRADNPNISLTCAKAGEKHGQILRLVNMSNESTVANIATHGDVFRTDMAEEHDAWLGRDTCSLTFGPKEIVTLRVCNAV